MMNLKKILIGFFSAAMLSVLMAGTPAAAGTDTGSVFSALENANAQSLSADEMRAVAGELNAYDIAASLLNLAGTVSDPRLAAYLTNLANYTLANAETINAKFDKYGLLTPCTSTLCP